MNEIIIEKLEDIKKITYKFYDNLKLKRFYEYDDVLNECIIYLLQTLKYYDENKSPLNRFLYIQINNKCLRLLENTLQPSKVVNYDTSLRYNNNSYKFENEDINYIEELLIADVNITSDYVSKDNINNIINYFKDDETKLKIIFLILKGYKRNEITKILNIKPKHFDYQRKVIRDKLNKIGF